MEKLTLKQQEALNLAKNGYSRGEAAVKMGIHLRNYKAHLAACRHKGHEIPESPIAPGMLDETAKLLRDGYSAGKTTQHIKYTEMGPIVAQEWLRSYPHEEYQAWVNAIDSQLARVKPLPKIAAPKKAGAKELLTLYTLTDYHFGMLAYSVECGDGDWDTEIAYRTMCEKIKEMIERSPDAETGVFCNLGDWLHYDSLDSVTPLSGHVLDSDTRYDMLVEVAMDATVFAIEELAKKHKNVKVVMCEGNHDQSGSVWLRKYIKKRYEKTQRISVDDTAFPYYATTHGKIMLAFHHGHKKTNKSLPELFASEPRYREMWGQSDYTYVHTGHYHKKEQDASEYGGAIVERHPTLAAKDAYAARGGWHSKRAAHAICYHSELGEYSRVTVYPDAS